MSRLHYDRQVTTDSDMGGGPPVTTLGGAPTVPAPSDGGNKQDYFEKVAKLVPSEVIAGYLAMSGFVPDISDEDSQSTLFRVIFFFCLVLTPLYLNYMAEAGRPRVIHLVVSSIGFVVWAVATTGDNLITGYEAAYGSILLVAFSLISGIIPLNR